MNTTSLDVIPELRKLRDLVSAGWNFLPRVNSDRELTEILGVYAWPDGSADAIRVAYTTDAGGLRTDPRGGVVWQLDGTVIEVVDGLLGLPRPGMPGAPTLVRSGRSWLWTPGNAR